MQIQIRDAVFETNSSSSHSVTVTEDEMNDYNLDKETIRKGVLRAQVFPDGYGWQWIRFYKPENVLAYLLYQATFRQLGEDESERGVDLADKVKACSPRARHIIETVEKATGLRVEYVFPDVEKARFYVDGDSAGNGMEFAAPGKEEELLRLIFGKGSFIELGNDNTKPGEYIESDIGDILTFADKMVDEPLSAEATFTAEFSFGWRESVSEFVDADGVTHQGVILNGWMQSVLSELRGATITGVHVTYFPERFGSYGRLRNTVDDAARQAFFRWLNDKNEVEEYRDYGEDGPTDIRLLRDFKFSCTFAEGQYGHGELDERSRMKITAMASREHVEKLAVAFDEVVEHSREIQARRADEKGMEC